jgi:hypothetical protein
MNWHWLSAQTMPGMAPKRVLQSLMLEHEPRNIGKHAVLHTCVQPAAVQAAQGLDPHRVPRFAPWQQLLPLHVAPMAHTDVSWQTCVHVPLVETHAPETHRVFSGQSLFCVHPGLQRGCAGSVVLHPAPSGQSALDTHPGWQLFDVSGFCWQICPLVQSESFVHTARRKQAFARHW